MSKRSRVRWKLFGITVASRIFDEEPSVEKQPIGGSSSHDFERAPEMWSQPDDGRAGFEFHA
jgi:hypothetical protein